VEIATLKQMHIVTHVKLLMMEDGWLCRGGKVEIIPSTENGLNMKKALAILNQIFGLVLNHCTLTVSPARVDGR